MENKEIIEGSKLLAEYMGMRYIPFNDYNLLMEVIAKLEKEDLSEYFYKWPEEDEVNFNFEELKVDRFYGRWNSSVLLSLDPSFEISSAEKYKEYEERQQLFFVLVDTVKYVNNLKNIN